MCGIAGIWGKTNEGKILMQAMLDKQQHRGPDATGVWEGDNLVLGHNRLSIIDLSANANQPMISTCGRYVIVFNGEIYNYRELRQELIKSYAFQTQSDTEVILNAYKAWGIGMLDRFIGMFAFAIWDAQAKQLFLARDRFGVKPLFYAWHKGLFCFASEIKALWAAGIPKVMNIPVWVNYFQHGSYGMPDQTFWKGIGQLPGGHYLNLDFTGNNTAEDNFPSPIRWYDFVEAVNRTPILEPESFKEQYTHLLHDAIRLRFRADVPLGFNISGGLDSSILLSLVKSDHPSDKTLEAFTFYTGDARYDELPWVEQMMDSTGFPLNRCLMQADEVPEWFEQVSAHEDEPFGGLPTLAYAGIFKQAKVKGIKVLLDGQGMDEAWAGYDYYHATTGATIQGIQGSPFHPEVLRPEMMSMVERDTYPEPFDNRLQNLQYRDLFYTKIPRALRFNDRISMMYSTELREPFLDHRLVELAFAQPADRKSKNGTGKALLREWATDWIGDGLSLVPKRPLQTPQREWLGNELGDWVKSRLESIHPEDLMLNRNKLLNNLEQYRKSPESSSFHLWQWISYTYCQQHNKASAA